MVDKWFSLTPGSTKYLERPHAIFGNTLASIDDCFNPGGASNRLNLNPASWIGLTAMIFQIVFDW
jgi:hypothetical protein